MPWRPILEHWLESCERWRQERCAAEEELREVLEALPEDLRLQGLSKLSEEEREALGL